MQGYTTTHVKMLALPVVRVEDKTKPDIVRDIVASKVHAPLVETVGKGWSSAALSKQAKEVEQKHEWMSDMASAMLLHGNDEGEWMGRGERMLSWVVWVVWVERWARI